ncbi:MAG: protein-glutamate O-methyltransferase family protein [Chloroflexi bacterium]|nr:protein-glutamate O-methyltransferase family protein [Chloroflexota bacterium]
MSQPISRPAPIRTDTSNAFANNTMRVRLPAIIDEVRALNPDYPGNIRDSLFELREALAAGAPIAGLDPEAAPDHAEWAAAIERQREIVGGEPSWHNAEWFFAETYAYRCLIEAVRWRETGRDPFLPKKLEELHSDALWNLLERAWRPLDSPEEELRRAVEFALWGNRIDLSYAPSNERGAEISADDLLVDDRDSLAAYLSQSRVSPTGFQGGDPVYIVADNAGSELAMDLVLAECLLRHVTPWVVICLKSHPTFVSDATPEDVWLLLDAMQTRGGTSATLAKRLRNRWSSGQLRFLPHPYWNSSHFLWAMPPDLERPLQQARMVIIKGDANYRRAVGDAIWPAHTPFADVLNYVDAPVLCLRTLKSDPVVGLPSAETAAALDRVDPTWRVNGKRGVIQFKPQTSKSQ